MFEVWERLPRATLGTCEPDVAGWVVHPAETLSALAYVIVGLILVSSSSTADRRRLPGIVSIIMIMGLSSMLFHSSFAAVFQALDLSAVYLLTGHLVATMLVATGYLEPRRFARAFAVLGVGGAVLPFLHLGLGLAGLTVQGLAVLWLGFRAASDSTRRDYRVAAWLLFSGAALLAIDHARIGCLGGSLEHVVQPHVVWHLLSAASVYFFCRYALVITGTDVQATTRSPQPG